MYQLIVACELHVLSASAKLELHLRFALVDLVLVRLNSPET